MAESYKSVICSIFLGKPNSLSVLCYNLLTFRWPALQREHYLPTVPTNDPHTECTHTHSQAVSARTHKSYVDKKNYKVYTCTLACADTKTQILAVMDKGKNRKETGNREQYYKETG